MKNEPKYNAVRCIYLSPAVSQKGRILYRTFNVKITTFKNFIIRENFYPVRKLSPRVYDKTYVVSDNNKEEENFYPGRKLFPNLYDKTFVVSESNEEDANIFLPNLYEKTFVVSDNNHSDVKIFIKETKDEQKHANIKRVDSDHNDVDIKIFIEEVKYKQKVDMNDDENERVFSAMNADEVIDFQRKIYDEKKVDINDDKNEVYSTNVDEVTDCQCDVYRSSTHIENINAKVNVETHIDDINVKLNDDEVNVDRSSTHIEDINVKLNDDGNEIDVNIIEIDVNVMNVDEVADVQCDVDSSSVQIEEVKRRAICPSDASGDVIIRVSAVITRVSDVKTQPAVPTCQFSNVDLCPAVASVCINLHTNADEFAAWSKAALCISNPKWMNLNCAQNCAVCKPTAPAKSIIAVVSVAVAIAPINTTATAPREYTGSSVVSAVITNGKSAFELLEVSYRALTEFLNNLIWIVSFLTCTELVLRIYCDKKSAKYLADHSIHYDRTKHIDIGFHRIRNFILDVTVEFYCVLTANNPADISTKSTVPKIFTRLLTAICNGYEMREVSGVRWGVRFYSFLFSHSHCTNHILPYVTSLTCTVTVTY